MVKRKNIFILRVVVSTKRKAELHTSEINAIGWLVWMLANQRAERAKSGAK